MTETVWPAKSKYLFYGPLRKTFSDPWFRAWAVESNRLEVKSQLTAS